LVHKGWGFDILGIYYKLKKHFSKKTMRKITGMKITLTKWNYTYHFSPTSNKSGNLLKHNYEKGNTQISESETPEIRLPSLENIDIAPRIPKCLTKYTNKFVMFCDWCIKYLNGCM